jgi:hypothetical protein
VIEGEGLGGFARRVTVNDSAEGLFRPRRCFFTQIAELPENSKAVGAPPRLTALPSSTIRTVFLDGIVRVSKPGSEASAAGASPPTPADSRLIAAKNVASAPRQQF